METVCIIGGGVGGLFTGALLAKEGYRVTVLEKNHTYGGGLQSFSRKGHLFAPGMHVFGGMQEGGNLRGILDWLGVTDKIKVQSIHDTVCIGQSRITLPFGREAWIEAMGQGAYKKELNAYVDDLYRLTQLEETFNLRPAGDTMAEIPAITAKELIEKHISDPELRFRLAYTSHLYDGTEDSPALIHALTSVLHIDGISTLVPSAFTLAKALADIITAGGGSIVTDCTATEIEADGSRVTAVICSNERYHADHYISAIPIGALLDIAPRQAFSTACRKRIGAMERSFSAFSIYGILKPGTLPLGDTCYYITRPGTSPWDICNCTQEQWPNNILLIPSAEKDGSAYADLFTIVAPMDYRYTAQWEDTVTGHRPDDYRQWKQRMAGQVMQLVQESIGPMEVEYMETASPLTFRDYYGTMGGSCFGLRSTIHNLSKLVPRTRLSNLYLTGQDVNFHGLVGTSLTAILTAEAIVGRNVIINKITGRTTTI